LKSGVYKCPGINAFNLIQITMKLKSQEVLKIILLSCFLLLKLPYTHGLQTNTENNNPDSFSFVFITDIHLNYDSISIQYFNKAVSTINKLEPDFILTGGDNIKDATKPDESYADSLFNLYKSQIQRFDMPVYTGIGNHECFGINNITVTPENPFYGKKMYESKIGKRYSAFKYKGWKFFLIDNIQITDKGHKYIGCVDDEQMEWVKKELATTDSHTPIVMCSHIPFISSMKKFELGSLAGNPDNDGVSNSIEFFRLFSNHNLKLLLQGHFHFFEVLYANNIHYVTGPSTDGRYGSMLTKTTGFLLFEINGNNLSWELIENKLP